MSQQDVDVWLISDTHFSHTNSLRFVSSDGLRMRREFPEGDIEAMDEYMIAQWNSVVQPTDKVYHLGDVAFQKSRAEMILPRLYGRKRLLLGNHDRWDMTFYSKFFQKIAESWTPMRGLVLSHRPLLLGKTDKGLRANIHGHIHRAHIDDKRYYNVSVEVLDYTPIRLSTILKIFRERGIDI